jgi:hypothetical protein
VSRQLGGVLPSSAPAAAVSGPAVSRTGPQVSELKPATSGLVLWHGVDAIELSWAVPCRHRLSEDPPDALEQQLYQLKRDAREAHARIESGLQFDDGDGPDPLMVHTQSLLGSPYALQCGSFLLRVNDERSTRPRAVIQLRSHYIQRLGAVEATRRVMSWTDQHLLPLLDHRVPNASAVWHLYRVDLTADVAGIRLHQRDLDRFVTRSRGRTGFHQAASERSEADATARVHLDGRTLTGFSLGARTGEAPHCRIYDKVRQSTEESFIRALWSESGYDPDRDGQVWRVEFELRRPVLREMRTDEQWLPDCPIELLDGYLNEIWRYCCTRWLRLHTTNAGDIRRAPVEPWWQKLAVLDFGSGSLDPQASVKRQKPPAPDTARLLASLRGTLTSLAAAWRITDIDQACAALAAEISASTGRKAFARAVRDRTSKWPVPAIPPTLPRPTAPATAPSQAPESPRPARLARLLTRTAALLRNRHR